MLVNLKFLIVSVGWSSAQSHGQNTNMNCEAESKAIPVLNVRSFPENVFPIQIVGYNLQSLKYPSQTKFIVLEHPTQSQKKLKLFFGESKPLII